MQVCLVSRNEKLCDFVSEVVGSGFCCSAPGQKPAEADFYVWDYEPDSALPNVSDLGRGNQGISIVVL